MKSFLWYCTYTCICSFTTVSLSVFKKLLWVSISCNCIKKTKFDSLSLFHYLPSLLYYSLSKINWTQAFHAHLHQYGHTLRCACANRDFQMLWPIACVEIKIHTLANWASYLSSDCSLHRANCFRGISLHTMDCKNAWTIWTRPRMLNRSIFLE